jgi:putative ABC transport system substrate-binding protein
MDRRRFVALIGSALAAPLARAQQPAKIYRVGWLSIAPRPQVAQLIAAFEEGLRDEGYEAGRNVAIEFAFADNAIGLLPDLARGLVAKKIDVIVCGSNPNIAAARAATQTVPIVFAVGTNLVEAGIVRSLARPGGNVTGISWDVGPGVVAKRWEVLKEAVPTIRRVAVLYDPPYGTEFKKEDEDSAAALGIDLIRQDITDDFARTFADLARARIDAVLLHASGRLYGRRAEAVALATKHRMVSAAPQEESVAAGGFMSYGPNMPDQYRRAAGYVSRIFKGAIPANLPVQQPIKLDLVFNLKTAKTLGIAIPPSVLLRADRVIE